MSTARSSASKSSKTPAAARSSASKTASKKKGAATAKVPTDLDTSAAAAFWEEQDFLPFWSVPMAHGVSMPWLKAHERGLLVGIDRARAHGKTVLLIDNTPDKLIDIFYQYQTAQVIEAKQLVLDEASGRRTHEQIMEGLRVQLVSAMRFGQPLYVRLADGACDFVHAYTSPECFPPAVFDHGEVTALQAFTTGQGTQNLWGATHPLASVLRVEDTTHGFFQLRGRVEPVAEGRQEGFEVGRHEGFEVVVCTQLPADAAAELSYAATLAESLPLERMQPIVPLPSGVRLLYSHYKEEFALEVGGTLSWCALDDRYSLSFVFKGAFGVTLVEEGGDGAHLALWNGSFAGLKGGASYRVHVTEDPAAEAAAEAERTLSGVGHRAGVGGAPHAWRAAAPLPGRSRGGSTAAEELASLSAEELRERSSRYATLREASELDDVVFGRG